MGLEVDYDVTPALVEKIGYAGAHAASFAEASALLKKLAECPISAQRVHRLTKRVGNERQAEHEAQTSAFEALSLPKRRKSPSGQAPQAVAVETDGGRIQLFDRAAPAGTYDEGHWRETKGGILLELASQVHRKIPVPSCRSRSAIPSESAN